MAGLLCSEWGQWGPYTQCGVRDPIDSLGRHGDRLQHCLIGGVEGGVQAIV